LIIDRCYLIPNALTTIGRLLPRNPGSPLHQLLINR
jgi:hypothetical protein